ncbi:Ccdc85 [Carabus blaptoides fortunei]
MSNKKQPQYIIKTASTDAASSAPPRYQPPPHPPASGILKHHPPTSIHHHPQQSGIISAKDAGKSSGVYPSAAVKTAPDQSLIKGPYQPVAPLPTDHSKFYPSSIKQYLGYHPSYPIADIRSQHQQQRPTRPYEDDPRVQSQDLLRVNPTRQQEDPSLRPTSSDEFNTRIPPQQQQQHRLVQRYPSGPEDEFQRVPPVDMLKFVRKSDGDNPRVSAADPGRHLQGLMNELRVLKEANQRLADDNQELRDLCCFLDDDRQKGRKLAREWQRFGRYTASVMRQEVSAYQSKLRELDNKQQELIKDNLELKELCLYLDEERAGGSVCPSCGSSTSGGQRDDGDGSSSSTNADEPGLSNTQFNGAPAPRRSASRERLLHENLARQRNTFNDQTMQYVRNLEQRVKQLEDEKRTLQHKINQLNSGSPETGNLPVPAEPVLTGRPEAVVRALQVLEVREQLEREGRAPVERETRPETLTDTAIPDMDDGEKALVREMCNVVWRKLEEAPQPRR